MRNFSFLLLAIGAAFVTGLFVGRSDMSTEMDTKIRAERISFIPDHLRTDAEKILIRTYMTRMMQKTAK